MRDAGIALSRDYYVPGEQLDGQIVVRCDKSFISNGVFVELLGEETSRVVHGAGKHRHVHQEKRIHLNYAMPLWGPGKIPAGENRFQFSFLLPAGIPPTYEGEHGCISYEVKARVEVPRAFDLNSSRAIQIIWLPGSAVAERKTAVLEHEGMRALYIEVESDIIGPGVDIPVRFVFSGEAKCRGVRLQILSFEAVAPDGCSETSQCTIAEAYYPLEDIHPNLLTQHLFRVDSNLPPPFISELIQVGYTLKVILDIPWGLDEEASIPLRWPS